MSSSEAAVSGALDLGAELDRLRAAVEALVEQRQGEQPAQDVVGTAVQEALATAVRLYAACRERDPSLAAFPAGQEPSATEALVAVTSILRAVRIEPFELGLWATWGLRAPDERGESAR